MINENLGLYSFSMASEGAALVERLSIKHIKTVNINFRPAKSLKEGVKSEGFGKARGYKMSNENEVGFLKDKNALKLRI